MQKCKEFENCELAEYYGIYVHGFLLPLLDQKRAAGELKQGTFSEASGKYEFVGEVDSSGQPCGEGKPDYQSDSIEVKSTHFEGKQHGICKQPTCIAQSVFKGIVTHSDGLVVV